MAVITFLIAFTASRTPSEIPLEIPATMSLPSDLESFSPLIHFCKFPKADLILLQKLSILTLSNPFDISPNNLVRRSLKFCIIFCTTGNCIKALMQPLSPSIIAAKEAEILDCISINGVCTLTHAANLLI